MTIPEGHLAQQLRNILDAEAAMTALDEERVAKLEAEGYRIVGGGQTSSFDDDGRCEWECTDWRTGETLASGRGTYDEYGAAVDAAAERDGRPWCHRDHVHETATDGADDGFGLLDPVPVPGMPESLIRALVDWVQGPATAEELADLTGLSAARVRDLLREPFDGA
jgi:hypothetical protein